jgi:hypothetical protein
MTTKPLENRVFPMVLFMSLGLNIFFLFTLILRDAEISSLKREVEAIKSGALQPEEVGWVDFKDIEEGFVYTLEAVIGDRNAVAFCKEKNQRALICNLPQSQQWRVGERLIKE